MSYIDPYASAGGPVTVAQLPTVPESKGGTNQTTYTKGDLLTASAGPSPAILLTSSTITVLTTRDLTGPEATQLANLLAAHIAPDPLTPDQASRLAARASLTANTPTERATRNTQRVIMASVIEARNKINQLVRAVNALNGGSIPPLTNRTWAQALAAVRGAIDAETDPST